MVTAKHIGRIGALAVALGVGMATAAPTASASASDGPPPDTTALVVCGTTCPKFDAANGEIIMNQFIKPTHPGQNFDKPIAVTTPNEAWPLTGALRVLEFALGDPRLGGPGGPAWPDQPLWKLSGLFDLTGDQSIEVGAADLEAAMAATAADPDGRMVVYGYSQGAVVVNKVREKLAAQYAGTEAPPNIDFVLAGDVGVPNGGFGARFPGLHIPVLDWTYDGAELTDTPFDTAVITRQYDGFADFPLYPLNLVADLNAGLGLFYVHTWPFDISLADNATTTPVVSRHGNTTYYFFESQDLPLFGPLRTLGVPEPVIDVFEPFFKVIVDQGYDHTIPAGTPTPARLIPKFNPAKLTPDLVDAIGQGVDNAGALVKLPASLKMTTASTNTAVDEDVEDAELQTNESVGAAESDPKGRTTLRSSVRTNDSMPFTAGHAQQTPLRDAVKNISSGVKKVVAGVSDSIRKAMSVDRHDADKVAGDDEP